MYEYEPKQKSTGSVKENNFDVEIEKSMSNKSNCVCMLTKNGHSRSSTFSGIHKQAWK